MPDREAASAVSRSGIRERAAELVRLHADVERAYATRDGSQTSDERWRVAAERFRGEVLAFYEPFEGIGRRLRNGDRAAIEQATGFLEADPWCFRSGYLKAHLMTALANTVLTEDERRRLRSIVLYRLQHREPRLLRPTGRLAARVWDGGLARDVERLMATGNDAEQRDAAAVLAAVDHKRRTMAGRDGSRVEDGGASRGYRCS